MTVRILVGDCLSGLSQLADGSVQTCVTSPPYWGLRDYGVYGQLGLEYTPEEYVANMVTVFSEVRRVLRDDGTLWLNLGDSYAGVGDKYGGTKSLNGARTEAMFREGYRNPKAFGLKQKDLCGIPWRVAFALQADGWWLRSDIVWHKPNPMPESVTDRPTKAHEYVFLLTKSERYTYDADAIAEPAVDPETLSGKRPRGADTVADFDSGFDGHRTRVGLTRPMAAQVTRNARTVWPIATQPYSGAHFATMPPALAERCIRAGSKAGDTVLDPFGGAGTTGLVADRLGRHAILCELNPEYAKLAEQRIAGDNPLFTDVEAA